MAQEIKTRTNEECSDPPAPIDNYVPPFPWDISGQNIRAKKEKENEEKQKQDFTALQLQLAPSTILLHIPLYSW